MDILILLMILSISNHLNNLNNMKRNTLIKMAAGFYLGAAPGIFFDCTFTDWRWWALVIPTVIAFEFANQIENNENN